MMVCSYCREDARKPASPLDIRMQLSKKFSCPFLRGVKNQKLLRMSLQGFSCQKERIHVFYQPDLPVAIEQLLGDQVQKGALPRTRLTANDNGPGPSLADNLLRGLTNYLVGFSRAEANDVFLIDAQFSREV